MPTLDLTGTGVALVTPFKKNAIDYNALSSLIDKVIEGGVEYIVSLGTTGEATSLSDDEQTSVIKHTLEAVAGRVPIVAGQFGGNNTAQLCEKLSSFDTTGISAILSSSPAYVKPSQEGIYRHYMELAEASALPLIIYNVPSRTASNISASTLLRLAKDSKKFIGVKDASADLHQAAAIARFAPPHFTLISGDDPTALSLIANGGKGVISVIANGFPESFSTMIRQALSGEWSKARHIHYRLLDLHQWLYIEGNPVGIKEALNYKGWCGAELRLPLVEISDSNRKKLHEAMDAVKGMN
ncbi:MAG TPA: 4-hydroxy-tetrahydrodipicolinate synthase [Saprospiraceae bacterium]|nr:4-hydroxy-tetrahydrodipicolinate synthase [Saprospiraceae bacterium]